MKPIWTLVAFVVLGCGGKHAPPNATSNTTPDSASTAQPAPPETLEGEIDAFHTLLAPLWHAPAGPARMKDTCAAIDKLRSAAGAVAGSLRARPNAGIESAGAAGQIQGTTSDLETTCRGTDVAGFDVALGKVHDAFHKVHEMFGKKEVGEHKH